MRFTKESFEKANEPLPIASAVASRPVTLALLAGFLVASLAAAPVLAQSPSGPSGPSPSGPLQRTSSGRVHVSALAVTQDQNGFTGVHSDVYATVLAGGSGQVFVSTHPLAQTDMQGSARLASQVAASTLGLDWRKYDFLVEMSSDSTVIGGPSAGGEMTLALTTALHNLQDPAHPWTLDPHVAGTGTINPDGTIGPVGGVPAKAQAAAAAGVTLFLYPAGLEDAPTLVPGNFGPKQVVVHMADACANLKITCRPVASIREVLEAAAHVRLEEPSAPAASTQDYAAALGSSVQDQMAALDRHIAALTGATTGLTPSGRNVVDASTTQAQKASAAAHDAYGAGHYYLAATRAFRGDIEALYAQNASRYLRDGDSQLARHAIADCQDAVAAARQATNLTATDATGLLTIAAAQQRAGDAADLAVQAQQTMDQAFSANDVLASLHASAFCIARAGTAQWWADLRTRFPTGPAVGDLPSMVEDAIEAAREMVAYAEAVEGGGSLPEPEAALQAAVAHQGAGQLPAALLAAIDAQTLSSIALQTGSGHAVPASVLDAARTSAQAAIAQARARGVEPVVSVSLVELAADQQNDTVAALQSLWTARSMALVGSTPTAPVAFHPDAGGAPVNGDAASGAVRATTYAAAIVMGVLVVLVLMGTVVAVVAAFARR